ncbi:hypothetical protein DERF_010395 [Dermatophagoides farinae]|uniref:Uncharacterized protein n=1 Tax=Dermatophagoides farinae TaxID=6954 RepID=A0A922HYW4_DERFA|nr:hypothetical protein DERF_010395 [Dermatophagoides farinae]
MFEILYECHLLVIDPKKNFSASSSSSSSSSIYIYKALNAFQQVNSSLQHCVNNKIQDQHEYRYQLDE